MQHVVDRLRQLADRLRREASALDGLADGIENAPRPELIEMAQRRLDRAS
jgi:hypothetical protein